MKATLLGDNGDQDGEDLFGFRRQGGRGSLGGAVGRLPRLAPRAVTGYAVAGLGGPVPTGPAVFGGGGAPVRPSETEREMQR